MSRFLLCVAAALAAIVPTAHAVQLNEDGVGQALLYPYYSVQTVGGNPLNTLISIVNHRPDAKAIRIRLREGRGGKSIARFNLYLGPNDAWAAALVPSTTGVMQLLTADTSCSRPQVNVTPAPTFTTSGYTGPNADSFGPDVERGREGWIEVIEMATLQGGSATGVTHNGQQLPNDCSVVDQPGDRGGAALRRHLGHRHGHQRRERHGLRRERRGARGSFVDAVLSSQHRRLSRPQCGRDRPGEHRRRRRRRLSLHLDAARRRGERGPHAIVVDDGVHDGYRDSLRNRCRDGLPHASVLHGERGARPLPFSSTCAELNEAYAGQPVSMATYTREELGGGNVGFPEPPPAVANYRCGAAATVMDAVSSGTPYTPTTAVFGSFNRGLPGGMFGASGGSSGWATLSPFNVPGPPPQVTSQPSSSRMTLATGAVTNGAHVFTGLPVIGFGARTFQNGLLQCGSISCQGNYGAAFPLKYLRKITPVN